MVCLDNGTEFQNAVVEALFQKFGVRVRTGAVQHLQSQGGVERFNCTILTLLRKTLEKSSDWQRDLQLVLFYYRVRPHSVTKILPFLAMCGWEPGDILVEEEICESSLSEWCDNIALRADRIRDVVDEALSTAAADDGDDEVSDVCPYSVGEQVLLRRPTRHRKLLAPFEEGRTVVKVLAPSTVVIAHENHA